VGEQLRAGLDDPRAQAVVRGDAIAGARRQAERHLVSKSGDCCAAELLSEARGVDVQLRGRGIFCSVSGREERFRFALVFARRRRQRRPWPGA
jgi:hypothetical protein